MLAGGFVPEPYRHLLWIAAPLVQITASYLHRIEMHSIAAGHFAERHGLVVIVAIGESIVAIGVGFAGVHLGVGAILVAVLGLSIAYYLWWFYFAGDDARAERVLAGTADPFRRARLALQAWGYAHYPDAARHRRRVGRHQEDGRARHRRSCTGRRRSALGGGVALYLLGHAAFLAQLRPARRAAPGGRGRAGPGDHPARPLCWRSPSSPPSRLIMVERGDRRGPARGPPQSARTRSATSADPPARSARGASALLRRCRRR